MHEITSAVQAQNLLKENPAGQAAQRAGQIDFQTVMEQQKTGGSVPMDAIFEAAGERYSISPRLLRAVAKAESGFNPRARSGAGAMGVMQLMPATARSLGVTDPYDPWQNIMGGAKYLKEKLDQFGDVSLALAAYNAGPGAVRKYGGIPPYRETQNYVRKVMADYTGRSRFLPARWRRPASFRRPFIRRQVQERMAGPVSRDRTGFRPWLF